MPVKTRPSAQGVEILTPEGELTLEARAISNFLVDADFSALLDHDDVLEHVEIDDLEDVPGVAEDAEGARPGLCFIPGGIATRLVDEADVTAMLAHYLDHLPSTSLQERATLAIFQSMLGIDKITEGCFTEAIKSEAKRATLSRLLMAMLGEATVMVGLPPEALGEARLNQRLTATQKARVARVKRKSKTAAQRKALKMRRRERVKHIGTSRRQEKKRVKRFKRRHGIAADAYAELAQSGTMENDLVERRPIIGWGLLDEDGVEYLVKLRDTLDLPESLLDVEELSYGDSIKKHRLEAKKDDEEEEEDPEDDEDDEPEESHKPRRGAALLHESALLHGGAAKKPLALAAMSDGATLAARICTLGESRSKGA